jgi:PTH1 family peptidyl-tRNA hydrolase
MDDSYLIAGLGNPGREYVGTRHNAGFMVAEHVANRWKASWKLEQKFQARLARAKIQGRRAILCEPVTYMNASGEAVAAVSGYYKVPLRQLLVVVDDADLPLGELRLRASGSSGGHHGLDSVERHLGTRDYARLRVGIGRQAPAIREITGHVLARFGSEEAPLVEKVVERAARQVECWLVDGIMKAMNQFNGAVIAPTAKDTE